MSSIKLWSNEVDEDEAEPRAWGSETRIRSCGEAVILVDQATEQISSANVARTDGHRDRDRDFSQRWGQGEGAMRAPAVVVLGVGPERPIEMPPTSG